MVKEKSRRNSYIKKRPAQRARASTPESQGDNLYKITLQFMVDGDLTSAVYFIWDTDEDSATHLKMPRVRSMEYKVVEVKHIDTHTPGQGSEYYAD